MKKMKWLIICLLSSLMFLTACGTKTTETTNEPSKEPAKEEVLTIWTYFSGNEKDQFQKLVDKFAADNGVKVNAEYFAFGDYKKQISTAMTADSLPDIIMLDNPDFAAYASMDVFLDITDRMKAWDATPNYFEGPLKSAVYDGKNYGIPITSNCLALFYNQDMLDKAGLPVPTTWGELSVAAEKLSSKDVYGFAVGSPKNEEATFQFLPWMLSAGGSYDKLDSPETIKAVALWTDLIKSGSMSKETINWGQGDAQKQFSAGKVAMFVGGPWMVSAIQTEAPDMKWGVATLPVDVKAASVLGGENIGIVAKTKNPDLAWKFLEAVGDANNMKEFIGSTGYFPPRADVAKDDIWTQDPIKKVFAEQMASAMPRGPHAKWPEISEAIFTALQESLSGAKEPEAACKDAQAKVEPLLK